MKELRQFLKGECRPGPRLAFWQEHRLRKGETVSFEVVQKQTSENSLCERRLSVPLVFQQRPIVISQLIHQSSTQLTLPHMLQTFRYRFSEVEHSRVEMRRIVREKFGTAVLRH